MPFIVRLSAIPAHILVLVTDVVEIVPGFSSPFGLASELTLSVAWLWGITINRLLLSSCYDVASRAFGLSLGPWRSRA